MDARLKQNPGYRQDHMTEIEFVNGCIVEALEVVHYSNLTVFPGNRGVKVGDYLEYAAVKWRSLHGSLSDAKLVRKHNIRQISSLELLAEAAGE